MPAEADSVHWNDAADEGVPIGVVVGGTQRQGGARVAPPSVKSAGGKTRVVGVRMPSASAAAAAAAATAAAFAGPGTVAELFGDLSKAEADASAVRLRDAAAAGRGRAPGAGWALPVELLPRVAIVGRPNVGKSALFNRITGTNDAIVHDTPGVTRDRRYTRALVGDREVMLIDTGGLALLPAAETGGARLRRAERAALAGGAAELPGMIEAQAAAAVGEADALMVVVDGQAGLTAADAGIVSWLRRRHADKPFVLAVNKCESPTKGAAQAAAFWETGATPHAVSAISATGVGDMLDALARLLPPVPSDEAVAAAGLGDDSGGEAADRPLRVAIVGRPNVGKSSILNCLAGEVRSIVNDSSGTTTDAIDAEVTGKDGARFRLIDTAGIRKRSKVAKAGDGTEELAVERAMRAMKRADVVALVLDAYAGATEQDYRIASLATSEGCALVLVVNKWDTVPDKDASTSVTYESNLRVTLRDFPWAPVVFTTATTGQRIGAILKAAAAVGAEHARRVGTGTLNAVVRDALAWKSPPMKGGRAGRVYYVTQAAARPPTFVLFVNDPELFGDGYKRYIERALRENIGFGGTPLRVLLRGKAKTLRPEAKAAAATSGDAKMAVRRLATA